MTAVYVIAIILLSLIFLVALLLLTPIKVVLKSSKDEKLKISIKVLFITVYPPKTPKKEKKEEPKKKPKPKKTFKEQIENVKNILKKVKVVISKLDSVLKVTKLEKLHLKFVSGGGDAAKAAINYGIACSVIYPVTSYVQSAMKVKKSKASVEVACLFEDVPYNFEFEAIISIRIFHLLVKGFDIYKEIKKVDEDEEKQTVSK
jgi:hypothetical protein